MGTILGKRKSRSELETISPPSPTSSDGLSNAEDDMQDAFRRAFEAKFQPLEDLAPTRTKTENGIQHNTEQDNASDWEGFDSSNSENEETAVEVVEHGANQRPQHQSKAELRAFMNSKPPSSSSRRPAANPAAHGAGSDDESEKLNLKNDLALQRLINESHILDKVKSDGTSFGQRQKRMDLRFQALGSKSSILQQEKMPLSHRRGINAKASEREERRRREARENGIVLEKVARPSKAKGEDKRLRGVDVPSVGKFKGGTLRLSKKDVADIKGPVRRAKVGKTGKRR